MVINFLLLTSQFLFLPINKHITQTEKKYNNNNIIKLEAVLYPRTNLKIFFFLHHSSQFHQRKR